MKKWYTINGEITEQEKAEIERKNNEIVNSGDISKWADIVFIYSEELENAFAEAERIKSMR